jgi:hypothetical protein
MKRTLRASAIAAVTLLLLAGTALAQQPDLPRPSPNASASQRVGLTDVTVEYSSPAVKGRTIWGELVPYGEMWRTGANAATKVTFSRDVKVGGKDVPAGTYSLFTIPKKDGAWTVILNKDAKLGGTRGYEEAKDQARFDVTPETMKEARERMTFVFADTTDDATSLDLEWGTLRLPLAITADTSKQTVESVDKAVADAARTHANAARWLLEQNKDLDRALQLVDASLAIDNSWYAKWVKAQIQAKQGKKKEALATAKEAYELGKKADYFFWEAEVKKAIEEWK